MRAIASLVILLGCGQSVRTEARPSPAEDPPRERVEVAPTPEPEPEPEPDDPPIVRLALQDERAIDRAVEQALAAGDLPGCVVLVGRSDGVVFRRAYGALQVEPSERPMLPDALFDLASLSKLFTAAAAIRLAERGELDLRAPVDPVLPELAGHGITAEHLLTHRAGLKAVNPLSDYDSDRDASMRRTLEGAPDGPVGTYRYSDLGYIALGELLARRTGQPLDVVITREVSEPLGLDATFRPAPLARVVPTERAAHRGDPPPIIHGEANDPRAWRLGGVAGHAGLFATANDLGVFAEALLEGSWLRPESRARFSTPQSLRDARGRTARRSLGADMTLRAHGWSERSFGHGGYTGTWLWVDPEHDVYLVVLSARVHPNGGGRVGPLRSTLGRLVHQARARMRGPVDSPIRLGIDVLRENDFARLQGKRVALLTNDGGRARDGARTWQLFQRRTDLRKIFTPEHGLAAQQEGAVRNSRIGEIEIVSLFGRTRQPTPEMF
ncbi:MAG: serine hydrolase, partial [Myxococcota bacterium]